MDEKWIFLLIINIDTSDNLYWHLVEIEKSSPPPWPTPLQPSITMTSSQCKGNIGKSNMGAHKDKGDAS